MQPLKRPTAVQQLVCRGLCSKVSIASSTHQQIAAKTDTQCNTYRCYPENATTHRAHAQFHPMHVLLRRAPNAAPYAIRTDATLENAMPHRAHD